MALRREPPLLIPDPRKVHFASQSAIVRVGSALTVEAYVAPSFASRGRPATGAEFARAFGTGPSATAPIRPMMASIADNGAVTGSSGYARLTPAVRLRPTPFKPLIGLRRPGA